MAFASDMHVKPVIAGDRKTGVFGEVMCLSSRFPPRVDLSNSWKSMEICLFSQWPQPNSVVELALAVGREDTLQVR